MLRMQRNMPDCSWRIETSATATKKGVLWGARGEFSARGTIRRIRCIRGIRVPPLNLDASPLNWMPAL
jgi:hypothetical protein